MNPRLTLATAVRILRQLRSDHRTIAMMLVVPCVLVGLLATATAYNLVVVALGLAGALSPLLVAVAMPLTSVSLVAAAVLLVRLPTSSLRTVQLRPVPDGFHPEPARV